MSEDKKTLYNFAGEIPEKLQEILDNANVEVISELTSDIKLDYVLVNSYEKSFRELDKIIETVKHNSHIISLSNIDDKRDFFTFNGRTAINRKWLDDPLGERLVAKIFTKESGVNLENKFADFFSSIQSLKIDSHFSLGISSDVIAIDAAKNDFNLVAARSFINSAAFYMSYLEKSNLAHLPIEVDYSFSGDYMAIQVHCNVKSFVLEYVIDSLSNSSLENPFKGILSSTFDMVDFLDIDFFQSAEKLTITALWAKNINEPISSFSVNQIELAAREMKFSDISIVSSQYAIVDELKNELDGKKLPGSMAPVAVNNFSKSVLSERPDELFAALVHIHLDMVPKGKKEPNIEELKESLLFFSNQDFVDALGDRDYKEIENLYAKEETKVKLDEYLGSNQDELSEKLSEAIEDKIIAKIDELPLEAFVDEDHAHTGGKDVSEDENTIIKGVTDNFDEESTLVKGSSDDEDDDVTLISGTQEEDDEVHTIEGITEEFNDENTVISSSSEDDEDETTISGSEQDDDQSTTIKGTTDKFEDEKQVVSGSKEDDDDQVIKIASDKHEKEESFTVKAHEEEESGFKINDRRKAINPAEIAKSVKETLAQYKGQGKPLSEVIDSAAMDLAAKLKIDEQKMKQIISSISDDVVHNEIISGDGKEINDLLIPGGQGNTGLLIKSKDSQIESLKKMNEELKIKLAANKASSNMLKQVSEAADKDFETEFNSLSKETIEELPDLEEGKGLTDFEISNYKRVLEEGLNAKRELKSMQNKLKAMESATRGQFNKLEHEVKKFSSDAKRKDSMLIKVKELMAKEMQKKDDLIRMERDRASELKNELLRQQSSNSNDTKLSNMLREEKRALEQQIDSLNKKMAILNLAKDDNKEELISKSETEIKTLRATANNLESQLKKKDDEVKKYFERAQKLEKDLELIKKDSFVSVDDRPPGHEGPPLDLQLRESQMKVKGLEDQNRALAEGLKTSEKKMRELEHKLALAQKISATSDNKSSGGLAAATQNNNDKASSAKLKLVEQQLEKSKSDFAKLNKSLTDSKKNVARLKSENMTMKNELETLRRKVKKAA